MDCFRREAHEGVRAILSDDHNAEAGAAALKILVRVALEQGEEGLQRYAFDVTLKLAELTGRVAAVHRLAAVDLADILFLD